MTPRHNHGLHRFLREDAGTTLVEFAIVLPLFLLLFLGLIDFGRLGQEYVITEKAMQLAARKAAVRPPACAGVPNVNLRGAVPANTAPPRFGTMCAAGATVCVNPGTVSCTGDTTNPTVAEIWADISGVMPTHAVPANLRFAYSFDPDLGFLGGPYTPVVTVEITNLGYRFVTPLGALANLAVGNASAMPGSMIPFPPMSVSLPAEDLALGESG